MRDFEDSTLWRVSAFERIRRDTGASGFARLGGATVLPTTLLADLRKIHRDPENDDVLEVMAACMRLREPALLCLQCEQLVWPVTIFPESMVYHSPRDLADAPAAGLATLRVMTAEPPGVRPPGHWMHDRVGPQEHYRPLAPMLWDIAMRGPRRTPLSEIGGRAAYRLVMSRIDNQKLPTSGALGPAVARLQRETVSLRDMAGWPGLGIERAARLLNALYLHGGLIATRSHPAAREEPGVLRSLFGRGDKGDKSDRGRHKPRR